MKQAIRDDNPVIVFEHKLLYGGKRKEAGQLNAMCEVPDEEYTIPFGKAAIRREGKDVTIVANMLMWYKAMEAADILEKEGISCEIIDPRTLVPFDYETVRNSIAKTGKLMIVHEDHYNGGWGAQLAPMWPSTPSPPSTRRSSAWRRMTRRSPSPRRWRISWCPPLSASPKRPASCEAVSSPAGKEKNYAGNQNAQCRSDHR